MIAVIMAGGKGTRISTLFEDIPKPMVKIDGIPVLEHEIMCLRDQGIKEFIITVSHMKEVIINYFGDGSGISPATGEAFGVKIDYFCESTPLGNAGALFLLRKRLNSDFLLVNADSIFNIDIERFVTFHKNKGGIATLLTHPNDHPYDSGLIISNKEGEVEQWLTKEDERPDYYKNCVNAGIHILSPEILDVVDVDENRIGKVQEDGKVYKVDLDRNILKPLAGTGKLFSYCSSEYVKDMGTPERFELVCHDFETGMVVNKNLKRKQKAIFLDRDGTINTYKGFLRNIDDFELITGVAEAIKIINRKGYLAVVISNQPVIARGELSVEELEIIHMKMETLLGEQGAYLDAIYYCPHHPDRGFIGERTEYKIECECRKPKPGMLFKAAKDLNIDLSISYMVGDSDVDVMAGVNAGCKSIMISNNYMRSEVNTYENLLSFVKAEIEG